MTLGQGRRHRPPSASAKLLHVDPRGGERDADGTARRFLIRASLDDGGAASISTGAGVGLANLRPPAGSQTADDHPVGLGCRGDARRKTRAAAVMRRHEHIAAVRTGRHKPMKRLSFDVAGEQEATPCRFHRQHEAGFVVAANSWSVGLGRRMQHADAAERIEREGISGRHGTDGDPCRVRTPEHLPHRQGIAGEKRLRHDDLPH